jgi:hypothetical protein
MNINPLDWPSSYRQLIFILSVIVGFTPTAYNYWKSEDELVVLIFIFGSSLALFVIVSISVFLCDNAKPAS